MPVAVTVFPGEIYQAPRSWTDRAYKNLTYFHEVDKGGHFAAWEEPELFARELRAAFRPAALTDPEWSEDDFLPPLHCGALGSALTTLYLVSCRQRALHERALSITPCRPIPWYVQHQGPMEPSDIRVHCGSASAGEPTTWSAQRKLDMKDGTNRTRRYLLGAGSAAVAFAQIGMAATPSLRAIWRRLRTKYSQLRLIIENLSIDQADQRGRTRCRVRGPWSRRWRRRVAAARMAIRHPHVSRRRHRSRVPRFPCHRPIPARPRNDALSVCSDTAQWATGGFRQGCHRIDGRLETSVAPLSPVVTGAPARRISSPSSGRSDSRRWYQSAVI